MDRKFIPCFFIVRVWRRKLWSCETQRNTSRNLRDNLPWR